MNLFKREYILTSFAELQERDVEQHTFLTKEVERLRARVATAEALEQENRALKNEVTALRSQIKSTSSTSDKTRVSAPAPSATPATRQPLGEISTNTPSRLVSHKANPKDLNVESIAAAKYAELQEDYAKLATTCERLRRVKDATDAGARKQREEKENWIKYAKKLEAKLDKRKTEDHETGAQSRSSTEPARPHPDSQRSGVEAPPSEAARATVGSSVPPHTSANVSFSGFEKAALTELSPRRATSSPPDARRTEPTEHAADSTQGDDNDVSEESLPQLPPHDNNLSSTFIKNEPSSDLPVVVSERRVGKRKRVDDVPDGMTPRRFKTEERSSDPLVMGESHHFSPQESLDLDMDGSMPTPRRIRMVQMHDRPEVISPDNNNIRGRSGLFDLRSPRSATRLTAVVQPPRNPMAEPHDYAPPRKTFADSGLKLKDGIASLAEDGYDPSRSGRHALTGDQTTDAPSRLSTLLNASGPSPQGQTPLLRPNRQSREASRSSPWLTDTPVRVLPFGKGDGKEHDAPTTSKSKMGGGLDPAPVNTKAVSRLQTPKTATPLMSKFKVTSKRLRDKPLASLGLEDFKINPKFNNGHNFAFTEVVRNRDERAEIPGCVDPECCGKHFRAMAQSELEAAGPSLIHRAADIALLEEYLGDQVYKLGSMTRQEKEELWLEAKTRELANKHGKHRHRFTRRQSPPGFWNANFPSTQENQKDRAEGEKREKRMIEERYREAMREGGRWLFRDE
jgi:hypothetical protein